MPAGDHHHLAWLDGSLRQSHAERGELVAPGAPRRPHRHRRAGSGADAAGDVVLAAGLDEGEVAGAQAHAHAGAEEAFPDRLQGALEVGHRDLLVDDERFENLPGYAYEPHYVEVDGLRLHHIDEGSGPTVVCFHGEPDWSYLYRHMLDALVAGGHRVVCPDLVGFGRSDKPAARSDYTYQRHVDWLRATVEALDLRHITLVCQDWGGLLGLRLVAEQPERFARVIAANTFLPTGDGAPSDAFLAWRSFSQSVPEFPTGRILQGGTQTELSPDVVAAYDAPFPDESYKAGARQFPTLVPVAPDDPAAPANRAAWESLAKFDKPFLCAFSDSDPITAGADRHFISRIPGTTGMPHVTIEGAGHFLQEDKGEELAEEVVRFVHAT